MSEDPRQAEARAAWFARAHTANAPPQAGELPDGWAAALDEMRRAYIAGVFSATIVLAFALSEAAQRRTGDEDAEFDWLRERRNRVAHLGGADYPDNQELEKNAQASVRIALRLAYAAAWR